MAKKMKNAPVYYALAQIRFNPLAALDTYVPAIQEKLRKAGYPDYQTQQASSFVVSGQQVVKPNIVTRYLFLNAKKTSGYWLDTAAISFQTTDYDTFDPFLESLLEGIQIVHSEAVLSYSDRVGIRFLDAVCPLPGETMSQYLQPYVLGLSERLSDRELVHSLSETRTRLGKSVLLGRAMILQQEAEGVGFPDDLQPITINPIDKFLKVTRPYAVIDTDSWIEDRRDFDVKTLDTTCRMLHDNMWRSFEQMVTPHALKVWD